MLIVHLLGVNRYFTLCSTEYLALGGGNHFALYLDSDLLNGSSLASETYGNSCLSHTQEFEVKEIELCGWTCFYIGVAAVAFGCSYYHLKPNDGHLVWDRLPVSYINPHI
uniref:Oxidation resistance protein 1 n=1 Tax=Lactuca sativa TaxID=4236 RepID=A0A9R1WYX9_LACSA|nr:hypothetical protein LSAT_V11C800454640 [Lactuca sativa]